ncbi:MAG: aminopeptidase [Clostridiales bacterium]|nr:aminopeptidase [Clostridiales bacterium]
MSEVKELKKSLFYERTKAWDKLTDKQIEESKKLNDGYKKFLDKSKTEREFVFNTIELIKKNGYVSLKDVYLNKQPLQIGDKVYLESNEKTIALATIGKQPLSNGINMLGAHIDSPRLDLKPLPLYEESDIAMLKTHYYGGVKKYQWVATPLAIHGVIYKENGEKIEIVIGENEKDPIFVISDILPHLAKDQYAKKIGEAITGENLNVIIGSVPISDDDSNDKVKLTVMKLLNEKYGIKEKDFINAEIEIVPAGKARDVGIDRGLIGAYAHDDRVCSYMGLQAILDAGIPNKTSILYLSDKEEIGSVGNTGAQSDFLEYFVSILTTLTSKDNKDINVKDVLYNSIMLSADVNAAFDPNFKNAYEANNSTYLGRGVGIMKYTGSRGKGGASDASSKLMYKVTKLLDENNIVWQVGELGKVDQGGGGTIAKFAAKLGIEVVDVGIPLLNMHAPLEIASKVDIFMTYLAFKVFLQN